MLTKRISGLVLCGGLLLAPPPAGFADQAGQPTEQSAMGVVKPTPEQLQQLVAPISLYPDELVAEVLAAATHLIQVVEADRWFQEHKDLQGKQLADEVEMQPWDSSVKALTEFPSVLENMDKNLSWTSSLGDAYLNQRKDVTDAVQTMRQRAESAGNLQTNSQQKVEKQGRTIIIEPENPDVVYVPAYDPWLVYGEPVVVWPGWFWYPGLYVPGPGIAFGAGLGLGFSAGFGWSWHHWGFDWGHRTIVYNHNTYISHRTTFINRGRTSLRGRGFVGGRGPAGTHAFAGGHQGFSSPARSQPGSHSPEFNDASHGGVAKNYSFAGRSSFGGSHAGGSSGFHGGRRR